ncbi:hypothetical protein LCGC14_2469600, partial [marine sediment metagenome]
DEWYPEVQERPADRCYLDFHILLQSSAVSPVLPLFPSLHAVKATGMTQSLARFPQRVRILQAFTAVHRTGGICVGRGVHLDLEVNSSQDIETFLPRFVLRSASVDKIGFALVRTNQPVMILSTRHVAAHTQKGHRKPF